MKKFSEFITEKKAGDMSGQEIKDLVKKTFPKASEEEIRVRFKEVYSWVSALPNTNLTTKTIKDITGLKESSSDFEDLIKLISGLNNNLDTDEKYEDFFIDLEKTSGLDKELLDAIDKAVLEYRMDLIEKIVKKGLKSAYRRNGTEENAAIDLALYSIKKSLRKLNKKHSNKDKNMKKI